MPVRFHRGIWVSMVSAALLLSAAAASAFVTIGVSITLAPPVLPVYEQPEIPAPGYLWVPGYWAWGDDDYYWVPGTWIEPPQPGLLWTPGYWGWSNGLYVWNQGYWGPTVGFYGGVNYGFGYGGVGYGGGHWQNGAFFYNTAVNHFGGGVHITNVYNQTVINNVTVNHVSFNGGPNGIQARPNPAELAAARAPHVAPPAAQQHQEQLAARNPDLRASVNHGRPSIAATARPAVFTGHGVVGARDAEPVNHRATHAEPMVSHGATHAATHAPIISHEARPAETGEQPRVETRAVEPHADNAPRVANQPHPAVAPHPAAHPAAHPERPPTKEEHRGDEPR